jgi:hypothetical protein
VPQRALTSLFVRGAFHLAGSLPTLL